MPAIPARNHGDIVGGATLTALGAYVTMRALQWEILGPEGPGPGFFPVGYGVLMVVLALTLVWRGLRKSAAAAAHVDWSGHARALLTWTVLAAALLAMQWIGFVAAFAALSLFVARHVFHRSWGAAVLVALACPIGFWVVFPVGLGVSLPAGPWGF